ncbi:hypothetical protein HDU81_003410 [Chytriomyces hyalinus]|nr:hypothetical protein HDU81_003410 [Chytriomyces hyalinus]
MEIATALEHATANFKATPSVQSAEAVAENATKLLEFKLRAPRTALAILDLHMGLAWPFVEETLSKYQRDTNNHDETVSMLLQDVEAASSGRQKPLAFVKLALMHQNLHKWLRILVDDKTAAAAYYEPFALMRDKEAINKIIHFIETEVSPLDFNFEFGHPKATSPTAAAISAALPNPTPLVSAISTRATENATSLASTAFVVGKGIGQQTKSIASTLGQQTSSIASSVGILSSNALGYSMQSLTAAKDSLDSTISSLAKKPSANRLSVVNIPEEDRDVQPESSFTVSPNGTGVMTSGISTTSPTTADDLSAVNVAALLRELEITKRQLSVEVEARERAQAELDALKLQKDALSASSA